MPSQIRVDKIADLNDSGAVNLPYGGNIPTGQTLAIAGNICLLYTSPSPRDRG